MCSKTVTCNESERVVISSVKGPESRGLLPPCKSHTEESNTGKQCCLYSCYLFLSKCPSSNLRIIPTVFSFTRFHCNGDIYSKDIKIGSDKII